jgi:phosphoglycolate phosphatase
MIDSSATFNSRVLTSLLSRVLSEQQPRTKLVITDIDGTVASFWDYFVPAMREFLKYASVEMELPKDVIAKDLGEVIDKRGSHEYPWLLEETKFARNFKSRPDEFHALIVEPFWMALDQNRNKYLRPFATVAEVLAELKNNDVKIVGLSDAPEYMARVRNKQLFNGALDAMYALAVVPPTQEELFHPSALNRGYERMEQMRKLASDLATPFNVIPKSYEKPNAQGVDRILKDFGLFPHEVVFVGDSIVKDGLAAASRGIRYIWAHYGTHLPAEYDEMIHYSLKPESNHEPAQPFVMPPAAAVAARFDELLQHI